MLGIIRHGHIIRYSVVDSFKDLVHSFEYLDPDYDYFVLLELDD